MSVKEEFISETRDKYRFKDDKIILSKAMPADEVLPEVEISEGANTCLELVKIAVRKRNSKVNSGTSTVIRRPILTTGNALNRDYHKKKK